MKWSVALFIIIVPVVVLLNRFTYHEDLNRHFITDEDGWELTNHGAEISQSFDAGTNTLSIQPQTAGEVSITIQGK